MSAEFYALITIHHLGDKTISLYQRIPVGVHFEEGNLGLPSLQGSSPGSVGWMVDDVK